MMCEEFKQVVMAKQNVAEPSTETLEDICFQSAKSQVCFHFECQGSVPLLNKELL